MLLVQENFGLDDTMKEVAKAMFVLGGVGNDAVELGAIGEAQRSAGGEGEQLAGHGQDEY
jgi:hypothetical protein